MRAFITILLLLAAGVAAIPYLELNKRAVSSALWEQLKVFAYYAQATYCPDNDNNTALPKPVSCPSSLCGDLPTTSTIYFGVPDGASGDVPTSYIAVDSVRKQVVMAFRGTQRPGDAVNDLGIFYQGSASEICSGCKVSGTIKKLWGNISLTAYSVILAQLSANPDYTVSFVGHSLGAAIATYAAAAARAYLPSQGYTGPVTLYSFASPRIMNEVLAQYMTTNGPNFRVTHFRDQVPRLPTPTYSLQRFEHFAPEYYIDGDTLPQVSQSMTSLGPDPTFTPNTLENRNGNAGPEDGINVLSDYEGTEHQNYIVRISGNPGCMAG